jgi:hypothetical protein
MTITQEDLTKPEEKSVEVTQSRNRSMQEGIGSVDQCGRGRHGRKRAATKKQNSLLVVKTCCLFVERCSSRNLETTTAALKSSMLVEGRKIEVKRSFPDYGERYEIKYEYCQHVMQWEINYYSPKALNDEEVENEFFQEGSDRKGYYDIIPRLSCYNNLSYNPYDLILQSKEKNSDSLQQILSFLIKSFERDQSPKLDLLLKSNRLTSHPLSLIPPSSQVVICVEHDLEPFPCILSHPKRSLTLHRVPSL